MLMATYKGTVKLDDGSVTTFKAQQHNVRESEDEIKRRIVNSYKATGGQENPEVLTLVRIKTKAELDAERQAADQLEAARKIHAEARAQAANAPTEPQPTQAEILAKEDAEAERSQPTKPTPGFTPTPTDAQ